MIIVKTEMAEIPISCNDCQLSMKGYGLISCPIVKDWLEQWQLDEGKIKLDNCPLEEV